MNLQINHAKTADFDPKSGHVVNDGKGKALIILPQKAGEQAIKISFKSQAELDSFKAVL